MFSSFLPQECLKEYLRYSKVYDGKRNRSKYDLIDMIINGKMKEKSVDLGTDMTCEEADKFLKGIGKPFVPPKGVQLNMIFLYHLSSL